MLRLIVALMVVSTLVFACGPKGEPAKKGDTEVVAELDSTAADSVVVTDSVTSEEK